MKYLFLDTNIFLHFKWYEEIPWKKLLNTSEDITVVLTDVVMRELEQHKDHSRDRIRKRAKKIVEKFQHILLDGESPSIPLIHCPAITIKEEEKNLFDVSVSDDKLLLNILHSPYDMKDKIVVSYDTLLLLKAKEHKLNYYRMDDSYKLAEEPTEEEKELKKAKQELERLTNRQSDPVVIFDNEDYFCLSFPHLQFNSIEDIVEPKVEEAAKKHPIREMVDISSLQLPDTQKRLMELLRQTNPDQDKQIAEYNQRRETYLEAVRTKETIESIKLIRDYSFKNLSFIIYNAGTAQTGDLHITLIFPDNVEIYTKEESMEERKYTDPVEPVYGYLPFAAKDVLNIYPYSSSATFRDVWNIEKTSKKRRFSMTFSKLTHKLHTKWDTEVFINTEKLQEFDIDWVIVDSNLVDPKKGKLKVVVTDELKDEALVNDVD